MGENEMLKLFLGLIILALGIAGVFYVRRRKFYRRNMAGIEEFKSYGSAVGTQFLESLIGAVSFFVILIGALFMLLGIISVLK
jgi:LPXTG-motif cell wall-anchored protein